MKKIVIATIIFQFFTLAFSGCARDSIGPEKNERTIVGQFGRLKVDGKNILDKNDNIVVLRGMSLFWSQWGAKYYNKETVRWLHDDWKCTVIRAAIGVENGGYLEYKQRELEKLFTVIEACIETGIYIIVDWHDHHAEKHQDEAIAFFSQVSSKYGGYPNIIYEIFNEPLDVSWEKVLLPYSNNVIAAIRKNDPHNLIVAGTPNWSQDVDDVIGKMLTYNNVAYSLHFYTGTHKQELRDKANLALTSGIPLFVTEWGLSEANGNGEIDIAENYRWTQFLENNNLSWCNWSLNDKDETSAAILPGTAALSGWNIDNLSDSGKIIRSYLIKMNSEIFDRLNQN